MTKILFVGYGGAHIRAQLPVIRQLQSVDSVETHVLALTTAGRVAREAGLDPIGFRDLMDPGDERAIEVGTRLARDIPDNGAVSQEETIAYLGLNFIELADRFGLDVAEEQYARSGRAAFFPVETLGKLIRNRGIDFVVASNAPRAERAAITAARSRNLPNLVIGDAFLVGEMDWLCRDDNVNCVAVFADYVRRHLVKRGRSEAGTVTTGNPALDRLADQQIQCAGESLRDRLGWRQKDVLTWALPLVSKGDRRVAPVNETLRVLQESCRRNPDLRVLVRLHPNNGQLFGDLPPEFVQHPVHDSVDEAIFCCDALLTEFSMVGLEAAIAGKPVVTIGSRKVVPYAELGLVEDIETASGLPFALDRAFNGTNRPDTRQLGTPPAGTATGNVVEVIMGLARQSVR